ncbi:hypothetical protein D3C78_1305640 [compost metagenome]
MRTWKEASSTGLVAVIRRSKSRVSPLRAKAPMPSPPATTQAMASFQFRLTTSITATPAATATMGPREYESTMA